MKGVRMGHRRLRSGGGITQRVTTLTVSSLSFSPTTACPHGPHLPLFPHPTCLPLTTVRFSVPFQESPKYAARRRGPPGAGLTVPPALLRANSDTSMALPDWMVFSAPGASSSGTPGPTSGPQGQSQPSAPSTKLSSGTLRSASSPRGARARSPSRGRHPEDAKRQPRGRPR